MSNDLLTAVWKDAPRMTDKEMLCYLALADQSSDEGQCWPAMTTIARKARTTLRHARKCIEHLEQRCCVERTSVPGHSNTYLVRSPKDAEAEYTRREAAYTHTTPVSPDLPSEQPRSPRTSPPVSPDRGPRSPRTSRTPM